MTFAQVLELICICVCGCVCLCIYTILICIFPKGAFYAWKSNLRDFFPFTPFVLHVNCFSSFYFMFSIFFGVFIFKCGRCVGVCTEVCMWDYVSVLVYYYFCLLVKIFTTLSVSMYQNLYTFLSFFAIFMWLVVIFVCVLYIFLY